MRTLMALSVLVVVGCGSAAPKAEPPKPAAPPPPVESAPEAAAEQPAEAEEEASTKIPEACAGSRDSCVMPGKFVRRLCAGVYPELALMFFQPGTPWRRAYLAVKEATPFNGLNGPSSEDKLVYEEELIVLSEKKVDTGGMQVSGAGASFDVLRWDGTCATLSAEEVRFVTPGKPKNAPVIWRFLEDATQEALLKNEALAKVVVERKKECKGATMGTVTAKCEKADRMLEVRLIEAVRAGTAVPVPSKVP